VSTFSARKHRLELPPITASDDPAVLKKQMEQMRRLMQDEFNRLSTDFYDFRKITFEAGVLPLKAVAAVSSTPTASSVAATWENPQQDAITPTHVRVRIFQLSPTDWAEYSYPINSWEFFGLLPATQYTLQIQLVARFETTDSFVSTTRNCPSVPVLRTAESSIISHTFVTDTGVGPPTDNETNDDNVIFTFPGTDGDPGVVDGSDCWWGYQFQYRSACAWADTNVGEAFAAGNVGDVTIDTSGVPFSTYANSLFRVKYREVCNGVAGDWVYGQSFMAVDFSASPCLGIVKSASLTATEFSGADMLAFPSVCQESGTYIQVIDEVSDNEFLTFNPHFGCVEYIDSEWTLIAADSAEAGFGSPIRGPIAVGLAPTVGTLNNISDFTLGFELKIPNNAWYASGARGVFEIMNFGGKIRVLIAQNTTDYSLIIQVPRLSGGVFELRMDSLAYGAWVPVYYVHDASEIDGRKLYNNRALQDTSTVAFDNDLGGITSEVKFSAVNLMQLRKVYAWDSAENVTDSPYVNAIRGLGAVAHWPLDGTEDVGIIATGDLYVVSTAPEVFYPMATEDS